MSGEPQGGIDIRYGEIEFVFAWIKVLTLIGLIIFGLIADLGGIPPNREFIGGRYWRVSITLKASLMAGRAVQ